MINKRILAAAALLAVASLVGLPGQIRAANGHRNGDITFGRFDPELGHFTLRKATSSGRGETRLTDLPTFMSDWSPDGRRIAFDYFDEAGNQHVATIGRDGSNFDQLTVGDGIQEVPKWSPDGRSIVIDASPTLPDDPAFFTSIWTMRSDGTRLRRITDDGFDVEPVFSPDGSQIAFGRITAVSETGMQDEAIYVVNVDGSGLHEVVAPRTGLEHPDWSPDGRWITFNIGPEAHAAPNAGAVLAIKPNGRGERVRRAPTRFVFFKPVWSPDGDQLLIGCADPAAQTENLCVMDADGRHVRVVVSGTTAPVNFPAWGPVPGHS